MLGILIYSNTFQNSFHFDDAGNIVTNPAIRNILNLRVIWNHCATRFFTFLSLACNYHFHQFSLPGYHLFNLAVHLGAALLVRWLIILTFSSPAIKNIAAARYANLLAFFGGLIFVAHPVQTQAVTYIIQRATSLATFFYLASLCLYVKTRLKYAEKPAPPGWQRYYAGSILTAGLALFTKEITITLPFILILYELCFFQTNRKLLCKQIIPFFIILLATLVTIRATGSIDFRELRHLTQAPSDSIMISSGTYLLTQFRVIVTYLRLLLIPVNQNLDYDYPIAQTLFTLPTLAGLCLLILLLLTAVLLFRKNRLVSFSIFWFFLTLVPESSIVPIKDVIFEHRIYLPMVGYSIFLPVIIYYIFRNKRLHLTTGLLTLIVICYSTMAYNRNRVWKNEFTIWNDVVQKSPNKARAYDSRGLAYLEEQQEYEKAIADFDQALRINPRFTFSYNNRANVYLKKGEYDQAIADCNQAITINPQYADAYYNRGLAYSQKKEYTNAIADFTRTLKLSPNYIFVVYYNRGIVYESQEEYDKAIADFTQTLLSNPGYTDAYYNRGNSYLKKGDYDKAITDYTQAITIDPHCAKAYGKMGVAYGKKGAYDKAIIILTQAVEINPDLAEIYFNRGITYMAKGNFDKAWKDIHQAEILGYEIPPALEKIRTNPHLKLK
ncbi:MAG: tetratricopeptide repeat protein [Candidatus Omnitrophota bacterium]